jgi:carbon-monoxide dehydrogenase large subunit
VTTTTEGPRAADLLGTNELRVEGRDKVSGRMQYTADVHRPNMLWAAFTTSPHPHAKIVRIDATAAKAVPGVRAVLTAADIGHRLFGRQLVDWPVLCWDKVRMIGDRVAAVAAETREAAEHAARLVEVVYEELPAVLDPAKALEADAPLIHPDRASYVHVAFAGKEPMRIPHLNVQGINRIAKGESDLAPLFAKAHRTFEHRFRSPRLHAGYIEPRSTLVWLDDDGTVHVQSPNKTPFALRGQLARTLEIPADKIVVEPSAIGGDFGGKGMTVDECPCYYLAKATGRPVRFVDSYTDELNSGCTRHSGAFTLRSAVDANGNIIAHHSEVLYNGGAYGAGKPGARVLPGQGYSTVPYRVPNVLIETKAVYTNTVPAAHVRSPNDVQIFFAWEQHIDMMAAELGVDSLEMRLRNVVRDGETAVTNETIAHAAGTQVLERLRRESNYGAPVTAGRGRGIAMVCRHTGQAKTALRLRLEADGRIEIVTGVTEQGGGQLTVAQRVAGATLGVSSARIGVRRGNTRDVLQDPGTGGSRVTHSVGKAAQNGALVLREELEKRSGMTLRDDRFVGADGRRERFEDVVRRLCANGPIEAVGEYDGGTHGPGHDGDFTFTGFSIEVDVDRETGTVRITDALMVTDVGEIINPVAHQGQIDGGFVYGVGTAMMEEVVVDESGKVATLSLGEYKLPTIADIPPFRSVLVTGSPGEGPYGAKMAGELSNTGVAPAIANAIHAAVGVRLTEFPMTAERVYAALHAG